VDRRLLVGEDEEADVVLASPGTRSRRPLLRVADAVVRQNFHWLQKLQVKGQPRAKLGIATRLFIGM
jgi:hypothetical protein